MPSELRNLSSEGLSTQPTRDSNENNEFVEFYLGNDKTRSLSDARLVKYGWNDSKTEFESTIAEEPKEKPVIGETSSNQKNQTIVEGNEHEDDEDYENGWLDMEPTNDEMVHDDKGKLLTEDHIHSSTGNLVIGGNDSSFGYTRIAGQKQAENIEAADKKTDFLFKKSHQDNGIDKLYRSADEEGSKESIQDEIVLDTTSPTDQLQTTKNLLTDSQKFAYIGLVKLVLIEMATELARLSINNSNSLRNSKFNRRMNTAQSSFAHWQLNITERLYAHLELNEEEVNMIEQLSRHGIESNDLAKSLKSTQIVENPAYDEDFDILEENNEAKNETKNEKELEIDVALTVLCDLFLLLLADSIFDSRSRTLLFRFAKLIGQEPIDVHQFERRITDSLQMEDQSDQVWNETQILKDRAKRAKRKKYMYVGLATIGGSLVLGLSGGLLAPVIGAGIAAGLTTIGISGTAGFLAGAGGTALVAIGSTAIGAKVGSQGMLRRVGDVKTFEFVPLHNNRRTNLIITVSGWMNGKADDIRLPFSTVDPVMGDLYSLLWEPDMLRSTGETIGILASEALTQSIQQILGATILMGLMSAIQLPMMLSKLSYLVDNPWNVSLDRAWKAGLILADTIIARNLGLRPITLLGFSLGSRVIYSCLLELAKRGAYGLVEKVIIFGSPFVVSNDKFALARSVVSGDFINGYSKKDWILGYLFRATSGGLGRVAGLSPIDNVENVMNFDCTELVEGHMGYRKAIPLLLSKLDFEVLAEEFVEIDEPDPEETERQRKLILEFDEARKQMEEEQEHGKTKKKGVWQKWFKPKRKEWWEMYSESKIEKDTDIFDLEKMTQNVKDLEVNDLKSEDCVPVKPLKLAEEEEDDDDKSDLTTKSEIIGKPKEDLLVIKDSKDHASVIKKSKEKIPAELVKNDLPEITENKIENKIQAKEAPILVEEPAKEVPILAQEPPTKQTNDDYDDYDEYKHENIQMSFS